MAEERAHALLSASSAKRWMNCPPSARLAETFPEEESEYAKEGTLAHSICELKLRKLYIEPGMPERTYKSKLNKLKKEPLYQQEMDRFTDDYVEYVQKIAMESPVAPFVSIEKKVDYSHVAPEGFGTADCIIIYGNCCHVIDFKYGKGIPVSAEGNPQMALYAIGAIAAYGLLYPIEHVHQHVIQPRLNNFSHWQTTLKELNDWAEILVKPAAIQAFAGEGEFRQGAWCDDCFCCVSGCCRHRADENLSLEEYIDPIQGGMKLPPLLSDEEVGNILQRAQNLAKWVKKMEQHALNELLKGNVVPGWKIVEGRSNRKITDTTAAYKELVGAGYKKALLYNQTPVSLTEAERLISKEDYENILANYIEKPPGAPTLAPETDKRQAYRPGTTAEEDFGGANAYKEEQPC